MTSSATSAHMNVCEWVNADLCCKALWLVRLEKHFINAVHLLFVSFLIVQIKLSQSVLIS